MIFSIKTVVMFQEFLHFRVCNFALTLALKVLYTSLSASSWNSLLKKTVLVSENYLPDHILAFGANVEGHFAAFLPKQKKLDAYRKTVKLYYTELADQVCKWINYCDERCLIWKLLILMKPSLLREKYYRLRLWRSDF
jgi:hypothetical protein